MSGAIVLVSVIVKYMSVFWYPTIPVREDIWGNVREVPVKGTRVSRMRAVPWKKVTVESVIWISK